MRLRFVLAGMLAALWLAAPAAAETASPALSAAAERMIVDAVNVTGIAAAARSIPEQVAAGVRQGAQARSGKVSQAELGEIERLARQSFTAEATLAEVTSALRKNFDEVRLRAVLDTAGSALAKRMTAREAISPDPAAVSAFVAELAKQPLAAKRAALINDVDAAARSSEFSARILLTTITSSARGISADCGVDPAKFDREFESGFAPHRAQFEQGIRQMSWLLLAYVYRDASDAELGEYAQLLRRAEMRWFYDIVMNAFDASFKAAGERLGRGILAGKAKAAAVAGKPCSLGDATLTAAAGRSGATAVKTAAGSGERRAKARAGGDPRRCLELRDNRQVMICSEAYR